MAKIMYSLCGDGIGHATRSKPIIEYLLKNGHDVRIYSYGKGYEFLSPHFKVTRISGLRVVHKGRNINVWGTLKEGVVNIVRYSSATLRRLYLEVNRQRPDLIISDFEPHISVISHIRRIPMFFIDNQHVISLCKLNYQKGWRTEYLMARGFIGSYGLAEHYFITSFFSAEIRKRVRKKATFVGPVIRQEIIQQKPVAGDYILVYMRSPERVKEIIPLMEQTGEKYRVYGLTDSYESDNISFKKLSGEEFLKDLVGCKSVITNGGHSLISESLYLGKPVYSIPTRMDFEQMINAYNVQKEGYGLFDMEPSLERLQLYISRLPEFRKKIEKADSSLNGNALLFKALDTRIRQVVAKRKSSRA